MLKYVIAVLILFAVNVSADSQRRDIQYEPIYAYQQKNINFDSLWQEINQFQSLSNWHWINGQLEAKRLERNKARGAYERGKKLYESGTLSLSEFNRRKLGYDKCELALAELEVRAEMSRISAEIAQIGMRQEGDEQLDLRRETAAKMRESLQHQVRTLELNLASARLTEAVVKEELERGRQLHKKGNLTDAELERREIDHADIKIQIQTLSSQIAVINQAVWGFNKSLERLFGEAPKGRQG